MNKRLGNIITNLFKYYPLIFTVFVITFLFQYSFSNLESIFYDLRLKFDFGIRYENNIVLILMDEESDEFLGESYPYTYASHSRMFSKLSRGNPSVVNYFGTLVEPGELFEKENLNKFKQGIKEFKLNGGAFRFGTEMDSWGEQKPPQFLQSIGYSLGLINIDNAVFSKDDVSRRAILNISGDDTIHFWTANQYRKRNGRKILTLKDILGTYYLREADATFSLFRYYTSPIEKKTKIQKIPFHRVVSGNFKKDFFQNKIVLIGPSYISNTSNFVLTPFNKEKYSSSNLSVHASIIQSLIQNKTIYQLPKTLSYIISIILAMLLSYFISKLKPTYGLLMVLFMLATICIVSFIIFSVFGLWLYISHIIITIFIVYYIWVPFRAIAEYKRRFAIQEESKLLKEVESLKQNFISFMSHDLKTPVAKISGVADVLKNKFRNESEVKKSMGLILDSTKELNKFINSILDLTKIESRNVNLRKVNKDVNTIIRSVLEALQYEIKFKNIIIEQDLAPLYPIEIDVDLVFRVLSNIIENAIKYTELESNILIKTWDDQNWVYIDISDNGNGISKEDMKYIFEKFYRVKNDANHLVKGTGLGLYLVKYFVELHGGSISVSSELDKGTTFHIRLKNV